MAGVITAVVVPLVPAGWAVYAQNVAAGVASWPIAWRILRSVPDDGAG